MAALEGKMTPACYAAAKNQAVTLEMLVEAGADINKPDKVGGLLGGLL